MAEAYKGRSQQVAEAYKRNKLIETRIGYKIINIDSEASLALPSAALGCSVGFLVAIKP